MTLDIVAVNMWHFNFLLLVKKGPGQIGSNLFSHRMATYYCEIFRYGLHINHLALDNFLNTAYDAVHGPDPIPL